LPEIIVLVALTFLVAAIYSSVGHGGASGYLAVLSFYAVAHETMAASALCLNILVAGLSFFIYYKAHHFSWKFTWPFVLTSIPFAFTGGLIRISPKLYALLLAAALSFAALRLLINLDKSNEPLKSGPSFWMSLLIGGSIGILSGMVGVGGGIFLSPILILCHWARPKETAATSAFFILVNSIAGLAGRFLRGGVHLTSDWTFMVFAAFLGGVIGSRLGARTFSSLWLRRILACVLFLAVFKLIRIA
jgi:uncharacterized protein